MIQHNYITQSPDVVGGKPHIAGRRITVQQIAFWHELQGKSPDEIAFEYGLSLSEIHSALGFYFEHQADIEVQKMLDEDIVQSLKHSTSSKIPLLSAV